MEDCCTCCTCSECCAIPLTRKILVLSVTTLLLVIGFVGVFGGEAIATLAMETQMTLLNWHSQTFLTWQNEANMDIEIYRRYFFFNITNPREVYYDRVSPDFNVIGPYVFKTNRARPMESIYWDVHDDVNFRYHDDQFWVPEQSVDETTGRKLDPGRDKISSLNMALFTACHRVSKIPNGPLVNTTPHGKGHIDKQAVCLLLDGEHITEHHRAYGPRGVFTEHTVHEWLFGYNDETLEMLHEGNELLKIDYHVPQYFHLQFNNSVPAPGAISFRHGQVCPLANDEIMCNQTLYHDSSVTSGRRWTPEGSSKVDIKHVGTMQKWSGNDKLFWFGEEGDCQRIRGTEGLFVGTNIKKDSTPEIFVDSLYRSIKLGFMGESEVQGMSTLRFGINEQENSFGPNSGCYHQHHYGALLNMSPVAFAPGIITSKYFYPMRASEKFMDSYYGNSKQDMFNFTLRDRAYPNKSVHIQDILSGSRGAAGGGIGGRDDIAKNLYDFTSHLDIHPLTGITLDARSLMQINTFLRPIVMDGCSESFSDMRPQQRRKSKDSNETFTSYFPETAFPMLLVDRVAEAPRKVIDFLNAHVETPLLILRVLGYLCLASAACVIGGVVYLTWRKKNRVHAAADGTGCYHAAHHDDDFQRQQKDVNSGTRRKSDLNNDDGDDDGNMPSPSSKSMNTVRSAASI